MGKRRWRKMRSAFVKNFGPLLLAAAPVSFFWEAPGPRMCGRLCVMEKQNIAGLPLRRCLENLQITAKNRAICDCARIAHVMAFPTFCSARFRRAANEDLFSFHKSRFINALWLLLFISSQQTQQYLTARL
jgi:hypothetical protein